MHHLTASHLTKEISSTESPNAPFCSPLFNIYMHDAPHPPANINIMSYADEFTFTSTHYDISTATIQLQGYLNSQQTSFNMNQLKMHQSSPQFPYLPTTQNNTKHHN